jgi:hypothetical protein
VLVATSAQDSVEVDAVLVPVLVAAQAAQVTLVDVVDDETVRVVRSVLVTTYEVESRLKVPVCGVHALPVGMGEKVSLWSVPMLALLLSVIFWEEKRGGKRKEE